VIASVALALLVGGAFAVLLRAVVEERSSTDLALRSQEAIAAADRLERLVLDLETGQRGFIVTRNKRFLEPWQAARRAYRQASDDLVATAAGSSDQAQAARDIVAAVDAYVSEYSLPLVEAARRGEPSASSEATLDRGRRLVDELRSRFDTFMNAERRRFAAREARADDDSERAVVVAAVGLIGSVLLIVIFGAYLVRAVALPIRGAAAMAGRLAAGELSTRMPETGTGEVGELERAFNSMAGSLEASRDDLRLIADEQAALRRVATLVAHDVPPDELFRAATAEVAGVLDAEVSTLQRYEDAGSAVLVAAFGDIPSIEGERIVLEGETVSATVYRTGRPARRDRYEGTSRLPGEWDIHAAVGAPIVVEARLWGAMVAAWKRSEPLAPGVEDRMAQFTALIATAIANAQSRAELAASRARVVASADEARRRIERDLHDGAQQSLVHTVIALKLARRSLGDAAGPAVELVGEALGHAERANEELRELAHGILPATLTRGLGAAIETLVSRVRLPVSVKVTEERLPPDLEATAYFIVAEALTNTVKHAGASRAEVTAQVTDGVLHVVVRDDGVGGARTDGRTGLLGLYDRVAAMNGELRVESPAGGGTTVAAAMPVARD
jgi:signal transduction histidine kinase